MRSKLTYTERVLNIWAISMILWSFYRAAFQADLGIWFDEIVAKPSIFLVPMYVFITKFEGKQFIKSVGLKVKSIWYELVLGGLLGSVFFLAMLLLSDIHFFMDRKAIQWIILALVTATSEVLLSQGFVLERLLKESKNMITSCLYASILNFFLNVPLLFTTPGLTGDLLLKVLIMQLSLNLGLSFLYANRRSVYAPILIKALYLLSVYLII
ncbi:MAG: CPBP family glutamic-type intramembrane protease [Microgenomates group bacterium]